MKHDSGKKSADGNIKGLISSIQDYSVHDGSGLRSIVFLKGCKLACAWCQNPESIRSFPEVAFHSKLCVGCGKCKDICPQDAIDLSSENYRIDKEKCSRCMLCVDVCPVSALVQVGTLMTVKQVIQKVTRYTPFYVNSDNGGVTVSGGDPLSQVEFTGEFLRCCREEGIHTAIETSGYGEYSDLVSLGRNLDLLLFDIKHMHSEVHRRGTGKGNDRILENLGKICQDMPHLKKVIRVPLIPGYNDDAANIMKTAQFVQRLGIGQIDLLPFNELPSVKYTMMGEAEWVYKSVKRQAEKTLRALEAIIISEGLEVTIGGLW